MIKKIIKPQKSTSASQKLVVPKVSAKKRVKSVATAKKSVLKKVAKQTIKKSVVIPTVKTGKVRQKKTIRVPLTLAPAEKMFWAHSGEVLASLVELAESFAHMDAVVYKHHVTTAKNDFAEWVEHVLDDAVCAKALRGSKTPRSARMVVVRHLKRYDV